MRWLLVSIVLLVGCQRTILPAPHAPTPAPIEVHADPAFTSEERATILEAADYLRSEIGVRFLIGFDNAGGNRIERLEKDALLTTLLSAQYSGLLYGATYPSAINWRVYLIPDRIETTRFLLHTAEHELLHCLGANHTDDPTGILYRLSIPGKYEAVTLSETDRLEIRRALTQPSSIGTK